MVNVERTTMRSTAKFFPICQAAKSQQPMANSRAHEGKDDLE